MCSRTAPAHRQQHGAAALAPGCREPLAEPPLGFAPGSTYAGLAFHTPAFNPQGNIKKKKSERSTRKVFF